jgi:hypothetical protein
MKHAVATWILGTNSAFVLGSRKTTVNLAISSENSIRTTKKTPHFTVTKINRLTLFKEIIAVYSENRKKHINIKL